MITLFTILITLNVYLFFSLFFSPTLSSKHFKTIFDQSSKLTNPKSMPIQKSAFKIINIAQLLFFAAIIFVVIFLLIHDVWIALISTLASLFIPKYIERKKKSKYMNTLRIQFKVALGLIKNSVISGGSIATSIRSTTDELKKIYPKSDEPIIIEFAFMTELLQMGLPLQDVLMRFKARTELEEIVDFIDVILITNIQGGNIVKIITDIENMIQNKIEVNNEVKTLTTSKISESRLLTSLPIIMFVMLNVLSPEYMAPMRTTFFGKLLTMLSLVLISINYFVGKQIVRIDV